MRRRVAAVWLVLAVLVAVVIVLEYRDVVASRSARGADQRMLLPVPVTELGAVEVAVSGTLHRFERDAGGAWFYHGAHAAAAPDHAHAPDPAMADHIERALLAFGRTRIERQLERGASGKTFGVTAPAMVIVVYRPGATQPLVQYAVGDVAPDTLSRYVDVVGGPGVVTIPNYQIDNLASLIDAATRATAGPAGPPPLR